MIENDLQPNDNPYKRKLNEREWQIETAVQTCLFIKLLIANLPSVCEQPNKQIKIEESCSSASTLDWPVVVAVGRTVELVIVIIVVTALFTLCGTSLFDGGATSVHRLHTHTPTTNSDWRSLSPFRAILPVWECHPVCWLRSLAWALVLVVTPVSTTAHAHTQAMKQMY